MEITHSGGATASFVYDADGNRVKSTVDGVTTVYIAGVFEFIENGATDKVTKYYEGNAMRRSGYGTDDGVFYLLQDHLNSSSVIVDQSGNTLTNGNQYYYPYGGNRGSAFLDVTTKRFTGQYHESSLPGGEGLSYYGARWYDPKLGRFLSADTLVPGPANPQAFNRYSYGYGNPVKFSDPSGHFSEEQLTDWYGEKWRNLFSDAWIKLLLDNPGSQIAGAQLGDLVTMSRGGHTIQGVFVTDTEGGLALWDVDNKTPIDVMAMGSASFDTLALYRIAGGETGSAGTRYGYLTGETQYLSGMNGNGTGPYPMKALGEYSTHAASSQVTLASDWFMGREGQGYYVQNNMAFQGFNFGSLVSIFGSGGTTVGAVDLAQTLWKGQKPTGLGVVGTGISVSMMIYGSMMYRPVYTLNSCSSTGVNYCGGYR